jgi:hypothetical protein
MDCNPRLRFASFVQLRADRGLNGRRCIFDGIPASAQVEQSHPIRIMVWMQSGGRYFIHSKMFRSE